MELYGYQEQVLQLKNQLISGGSAFSLWIGTLFLAGFTPLPFKIFTITSGIINFNIFIFFIICIISRGLRFFIVAYFSVKLGKPFVSFLEKKGNMNDTMIIFTSDHGDYLGDHWLGDKELFHEQIVKVPMIIYDPRDVANKTRGKKEKRFVEAIDLLPTFLDAVGSKESKHRLEGNSLVPLINADKIDNWKDAVFSEIDYSFNEARKILNLGASDARGYMIRNNEWKYIYFKSFPPQLFNLKNDPEEFDDLGQSKDYSKVRNEMKELLLKKLVSRKNRVAASDEFVLKDRDYTKDDDIMIGVW